MERTRCLMKGVASCPNAPPRARRIPTAIRINRLPGPERAADPGRLGANRRPRSEPVAGSAPTRSFGSPQGEKIAKPHIDFRHRLRIHDSGDVDDPFARYGPRLLGHGVRRTTQNKLRPPQQNVIRPTAADRRCRDDDCKRIGLLETEVPGGRRGPGGVPPARGRASGLTRPTRPRLCKGRQPCHASLEATSQARNSSQ